MLSRLTNIYGRAVSLFYCSLPALHIPGNYPGSKTWLNTFQIISQCHSLIALQNLIPSAPQTRFGLYKQESPILLVVFRLVLPRCSLHKDKSPTSQIFATVPCTGRGNRILQAIAMPPAIDDIILVSLPPPIITILFSLEFIQYGHLSLDH